MRTKQREAMEKKTCIIIDGAWGVGKTYCVRGLLDEREDDGLSPTVYCSLFGKDITMEEFERKLKAQILFKYVLKKSDGEVKSSGKSRFQKVKPWGRVLKSILQKGGVEVLQKFGIDLNTYIDNVSIEDIPVREETIVVVDDIERKSGEIRFDDILGLAERMTENFTVVLILNSEKLNEEDREAYRLFREKVVDFDLKIDEITKEYLYDMLGTGFSEFKKYYILQRFVSRNATINNIRIAEKLCKLIVDIQKELRSTYCDENYQIQDDYIREAHNVIDNRFLGISERKSNEVIYDYVEKIFEEDMTNIKRLRKTILENYPAKGDVEGDCLKIIKGYEISAEAFENVVSKVKEKVNKLDKGYFKKQSEVLMVCEAFCQIGIEKEYRTVLWEMAKNLYSFNEIYVDLDLNYGALSPCFWGKEPCELTKEMCDEINKYNRNKTLQDIKMKMDVLLKEDKFSEYYDYVDTYDYVVKEDTEYVFEHIQKLYEKELQCHHDEYFSGLCLLMHAVVDAFREYLLERAEIADIREYTLILRLQERLNMGDMVDEAFLQKINKLISMRESK